MWHSLMYQKHIEFKKKTIQNFYRPCPTGDTSLWDFSLMTLLRLKDYQELSSPLLLCILSVVLINQ